MNNAILIGRLTRDPELRYLAKNNRAVVNFTLAVDRKLSKKKKKEYEEKGLPTADFINITAWGKLAETCGNYLQKGRLVAVEGRIQTRSYEVNDGSRRYITEVVANNLEFLDSPDSKASNNNLDGFDLEGFSPFDDDNIPF